MDGKGAESENMEKGGLIGIIANDFARVSIFPYCVTKMAWEAAMGNIKVPAGTQLEWLIGGDWCGARNTLVEMALQSGAEWLWFMDDDHAFSPDLLPKLLRHDVPLVVPVCLTRVPPFQPVTYQGKLGNKYLPLYMPDQPDEGLIELDAGGCAGMLIKREVLEAIEPPWFEYTDRSEDIVFCEKAKAAGFKLYCDLEARLGHVTTAIAWPVNTPEDWKIGFTVGRDLNIFTDFSPNEELE